MWPAQYTCISFIMPGSLPSQANLAPSRRPRSMSTTTAALLNLLILISGSSGDRPALRVPSRGTQPAQGQGAGWLSTLAEAPPSAQHDYANLAVLPLLSGLTLAALRTERAHLPLAILLLAYMALDALWMVVQPSVVKAPPQPVESAVLAS